MTSINTENLDYQCWYWSRHNCHSSGLLLTFLDLKWLKIQVSLWMCPSIARLTLSIYSALHLSKCLAEGHAMQASWVSNPWSLNNFESPVHSLNWTGVYQVYLSRICTEISDGTTTVHHALVCGNCPGIYYD